MAAERNPVELLETLIARVKRAGADAADAVLVDSTHVSVACRLGELEKVERSETCDLGLRVLVGKRQAIVSSSDRSDTALAELSERALAMARTVPEDPYCGLAEPEQLAKSFPDLDIDDPNEPSTETLIDYAKRAEDEARAVKGVSNSEGGDVGWGRSHIVVAGSNGFSVDYWTSGSQIAVSVLAEDKDGGMERDYAFSSKVYFEDLTRPEDIGRLAAARAVRRLGGKKIKSARMPVIFDPRISGGLMGHLAGAINGASIARGVSFLKDCLGKQILPRGMNVIDDPHLVRGLRSKPCDGEGIANRRRMIVEDGVLQSWILDLGAARQLGLETTGHAARGASSSPSPSITNFWLEPGEKTVAQLLKDVGTGFYVTDLIGMGVNGVTGDYSKGAAGFMIEDGKFSYAVTEVTVAGNLKDMLMNVTAARDLEHRYGVDAPTLVVEGMTIAGA